MNDIIIFEDFSHILIEVAFALIPLIALFMFFQTFFLKLSSEKIVNLFIGIIFTFIGLSFFLQGVNIGFIPAGQEIGVVLGNLPNRWILIIVAFILGFVTVFAEPAVRILTSEVEKVSSGYIPQKIMLYTLSFAVAISLSLAMIRIIYKIPFWYFIVPGYFIMLLLMPFSNRTFISIAFDSGGVASGPMTDTFILAFTLGVSSAFENSNPLTDGFGMIALISLTPILCVMILGLLFNRKEKNISAK